MMEDFAKVMWTGGFLFVEVDGNRVFDVLLDVCIILIVGLDGHILFRSCNKSAIRLWNNVW